MVSIGEGDLSVNASITLPVEFEIPLSKQEGIIQMAFFMLTPFKALIFKARFWCINLPLALKKVFVVHFISC